MLHNTIHNKILQDTIYML